MSGRWLIAAVLAGTLALPRLAAAQPLDPLSVSLRANIAPSEAGTSAVVGASAVYALSARVALDGEATWFSHTRRAESWGVAIAALVAVGPSTSWSDNVVPYVGAGFGVLRSTVDRRADDLPDFYARRLGPGDQSGDRHFSDPVVALGAGLRIGGQGPWFLQPEARVWVAVADGRTSTSGLFGIAVGYRF